MNCRVALSVLQDLKALFVDWLVDAAPCTNASAPAPSSKVMLYTRLLPSELHQFVRPLPL